ncbi:MAG: hypothetical protein JW894_01690 [Bacteroidales bacterium]|nr:hypothetical protein [Bacteroidales bacterium]
MKKIQKCSLILILSIFVFIFVGAQDSGTKNEISVSGGAILPGNVKASYESYYPDDETVDIKNAVSPLIKIVFDYRLKEHLSIGGNLNIAKFNIKDILFEGSSIADGNEVNLGYWDGREHVINLDDIKMMEINGSIKGILLLSENMVLKPCLYLGYRRTFSSSQGGREQGVVINYNAEFQYYFKPDYFLLADMGFIAQPYDGVHDVGYVRTLGVPYITLGVGIAR